MKKSIAKSLLMGLCTIMGMNACSAATEKSNKENKIEMNTDAKKLEP